MAGTGGRGRPGRRLRRVDETSAGGLVVANDPATGPRAALIGRTDRRGRLLWSLPKGHIEEGETPEDTAVTEVAWVPLDELSGRLAYADERALVERAPALLADSA